MIIKINLIHNLQHDGALTWQLSNVSNSRELNGEEVESR